MQRRGSLEALGAALVAAQLGRVAGPASARSAGPIVLVVPFGAGGTTDWLGRLVARNLAVPLGRTIVVENRPGAASAIGAAHVARAAPDGNTLLIATCATLAINPSLYTRLAYDPLRDFAPIGMIGDVPLALVVPPALQARSVTELLMAARRKPGGLVYGSPGNGSPQHLAAEMFRAATGAMLRHVPYGSTSAALNDVAGGQLDLMFADIAPVLPHVQSRRLMVLGVTSLKSQSTLPDAPPLAASGVAELAQFEVAGWQSLVAPAGTPAEIVGRLNGLLNALLEQPAVRSGLQREGVEPRSGTPEELGLIIRAEISRWAKIIRTARIAID